MEEVVAFGETHGFPIMIKAALGGGGRGMRVAHDAKEAREGYERAKSEAKAAFGSDEVYVEKYISNPKHIEVQILGDHHGNVLHLFERDCSVQRRHQKVVEVAPCVSMNEEQRAAICSAAVQLMAHVGYVNAGTVEFLVEGDQFYFIEVNPRVQVEHTITEMITDIDIVISQLQIAQGLDLHKDMHLPKQNELTLKGAAIQCRITTEDPLNQFMPDTGKIDTYRSSGAGGQHVNTTDSAVRITHLPTGVIATSSEKSQIQNREKAMKVLRARVYDQIQQEAQSEYDANRKSAVGTGDRSERIRTYNFPQNRVTDHRIGLTIQKLDQILAGKLDEIIDALVLYDQTSKLEEMQNG